MINVNWFFHSATIRIPVLPLLQKHHTGQFHSRILSVALSLFLSDRRALPSLPEPEPKRGGSQGLAKQAAKRAKLLDGRRSEGYRV